MKPVATSNRRGEPAGADRAPRALLIATSFHPVMGGIETVLYQTARRLSLPPAVVAPAPAAGPGLDVNAVPLFGSLTDRAVYRATWPLHPALYYLRALWPAAAQAVRVSRARVILAGHVYLAPLALLLAARSRAGAALFTYGQEVWREGRTEGAAPLDRAFRGAALRRMPLLFSLGRFTTGLLASWGVDPDRVVEVPFGAEPCPRAHPADPRDPPVLLSVGRLVPRKGIDVVIQALPRLARHWPDLRYEIVGTGPDETRLRRLARSAGVAEHVVFRGRVTEPEMADAYERCSLFVLPSRRTNGGELEGLGLVYLEAAARARPVVAGRSGGEADAVLDGETGRLVDGTSVDAVARTIEELLADPPLRKRLGGAGYERVRTRRNWDQAARCVDEALGRLVGQERR